MTGSNPATEPARPLNAATLTELPAAFSAAPLDRARIRPGIVHIGVGGFHRAHLATYAHELCAQGHTDWGIAGVGVMAGDARMADALGPQDCLYTLISRGANSTEVTVIASIVEFIHAASDPSPAIARIADPATQIVSMTITEGGYPVSDLTGEYRSDSPNAGPASAFGIIAAGLDRRRRDHGAPVTVMSCDNVMGNGSVARAATMGEAARHGQELLDWIATSVSFPNSMVDRITPATADSDRSWLAETHGVVDRWPVVAEPFRQWVIEDDFAGARPPLELLDVIVTDDVEPYEFMKLRLLNAGHSCMAYLAALIGIDSVDRAMAEPAISDYLRRFLHDEAKPVLPPVDIDVDTYIDTLAARFENPAIGDQIARLCLDGSAKFPKFLMPTVRAQLAVGGPVRLAALALAGWCQYLVGETESGSTIEPASDPALAQVLALAKRSIDEPAAFLEFDPVFGDEVGGSPVFRTALIEALGRLRTKGVRSAIETAIGGGAE